MDKNDLGTKFICYQCGCRFYDLKRPEPLCPQCGTDQSKTPPKGIATKKQDSKPSHSPPKRTRSRRKKKDETIKPDDPFNEDGTEKDDVAAGGLAADELADGLSVIQDEDLIDPKETDLPEEE